MKKLILSALLTGLVLSTTISVSAVGDSSSDPTTITGDHTNNNAIQYIPVEGTLSTKYTVNIPSSFNFTFVGEDGGSAEGTVKLTDLNTAGTIAVWVNAEDDMILNDESLTEPEDFEKVPLELELNGVKQAEPYGSLYLSNEIANEGTVKVYTTQSNTKNAPGTYTTNVEFHIDYQKP